MTGYGRIRGLTSAQVASSAQKYGRNEITKQKRHSFFRQFLSSFNDPIIKILLAALFFNVVFWIRSFDPYEAVGILLAVLVSTLISASSEYGAEGAVLSLLEETSRCDCTVLRDGETVTIPATELVRGDVVLLRAGEKIHADGVIIYGEVFVNQAALNGEGEEVRKAPSEKNTTGTIGDTYSLFSGCLICGGEGLMLVNEIGDTTFYGQIASELSQRTPDSPLKLRLSHLARTISKFGYISAAFVACADLFNTLVIDKGFDTSLITQSLASPSYLFSSVLHALTLALSVVIVAVPEGLPMMIGVVLSRNIGRMKDENVLVRRPVGIETAGGIGILFTDKTGTLTTGVMEVSRFITGDGASYDAGSMSGMRAICDAYSASVLINTSCTTDGSGSNATDRALFSSCPDKKAAERARLLDKTPFSSELKYSSASASINGKTVFFIKGACEVLLDRCSLCLTADGKAVPVNRARVQSEIKKHGTEAYRMILVAVSDRDGGALTLVCIACLSDTVRPQASHSVSRLRGAGVDVVMITGDSVQTASAVARRVGILGGRKTRVITGAELGQMSDEGVKQLLPSLAVVARAYPADKSRLVRLCGELGLVSGMTGDGVNDSPALRCADVGFAMGSGTAVARESGDIIILDDNISSVTKAVLYGRTIFKSIRKFLVFQLTMNFCAVVISMLAPLIGCETPVTVVQMLWINIIMDTLASLAFAGECPRGEYMDEKPAPRSAPVLNGPMKKQILISGSFCVAVMLWYLKSPFVSSFFGTGAEFYCGFFTLFVALGVFNCLNARTHSVNLFSYLSRNKSFIFIILFIILIQLALIYFGGSVFRCTPLTAGELAFVISLAVLVIPVDMLRKVLCSRS